MNSLIVFVARPGCQVVTDAYHVTGREFQSLYTVYCPVKAKITLKKNYICMHLILCACIPTVFPKQSFIHTATSR